MFYVFYSFTYILTILLLINDILFLLSYDYSQVYLQKNCFKNVKLTIQVVISSFEILDTENLIDNSS